MVESVLEKIANYKSSTINLIDIGTGSGCIAISLAKELNKNNFKFNGFALDISKKALVVAKNNAKKHEINNCIKFLYSDLLNIIDFKKITGPIFITANLPYLTPEQIKSSPSIQKEPKTALESGPEGLDHYRKLFQQISKKGLSTKKELVLFCEIDDSQKNNFLKLTTKELPNAEVTIKKDLGSQDRLVILSF